MPSLWEVFQRPVAAEQTAPSGLQHFVISHDFGSQAGLSWAFVPHGILGSDLVCPEESVRGVQTASFTCPARWWGWLAGWAQLGLLSGAPHVVFPAWCSRFLHQSRTWHCLYDRLLESQSLTSAAHLTKAVTNLLRSKKRRQQPSSKVQAAVLAGENQLIFQKHCKLVVKRSHP